MQGLTAVAAGIEAGSRKALDGDVRASVIADDQGGKQRRWRCSRASSTAWLGGEDKDVVPELGDTLERR